MMRRVESPLDQESPVVEAGVNITVIIVFICLNTRSHLTSARCTAAPRAFMGDQVLAIGGL